MNEQQDKDLFAEPDRAEKYPEKYRVSCHYDPETGGIYIPKNLDEAIVELKLMLHPDFIEDIRNTPMNDFKIETHFELGLWIRNNWRLWGNSVLAQSLGGSNIVFPDDMSSKILEEFWKSLQKD